MINKRNVKTIVVTSAVGGVGRTTVTVNLAALLAERNINVSVIDADLQFGDISCAFDLHPTRTMKEAAERKDADNIHFYLMRHASGVNVLPSPSRPEYAELITPEFLHQVVEKMKEDTEVLLIEAQAGLHDSTIQLMEEADLILSISTPHMAALKNTKLMLDTLELLGLNEKVKLVINQFTAKNLFKPKEIWNLIDIDLAAQLTKDDKHIGQSLDIGRPVVLDHPKLNFTAELEKLLEELELFSGRQIQKAKDKSGLLQWLRLRESGQEG